MALTSYPSLFRNLIRRHPAPFGKRTGHGVDAALDLQPFLEIDDMGLLSLDRRYQFAAFDHLQIIEAEAVAGGGDEAVIGLVVGAARMVLKPCSSGRPSVV